MKKVQYDKLYERGMRSANIFNV